MVSSFVYHLIAKYTEGNEKLRQILTVHSEMVARKALEIVEQRGLSDKVDIQFLEDASMLHDIGIVRVDAPSIHCYGTEPYIRHGITGAEILKTEGLPEEFQRVCMRHTGSGITAEEIMMQKLPLPAEDLIPETLEERLICYADKFFSKSRDLRYEKKFEEIERSMRKFGEKAFSRFMELRMEFAGKAAIQ